MHEQRNARGSGERVNVVALVKDGERYIFTFDRESHREVRAKMYDLAKDPELSFTAHDAFILGSRVNRMVAESANANPPLPNLDGLK